jgi:hypothetical protein
MSKSEARKPGKHPVRRALTADLEDSAIGSLTDLIVMREHGNQTLPVAKVLHG